MIEVAGGTKVIRYLRYNGPEPALTSDYTSIIIAS
jgi:hypothetical protein